MKDKKENLPEPQEVKPANHHDIFFKGVYSYPEFAFELFKLIFYESELKAYDWSQLTPEKDTLGDNRRADLIFSVPLKADTKVRVKIFILLEHKAHYDRNTFEQVLQYLTLLRQRIVEEKGYPIIIPVLFYHGKKPWRWPLSLEAVSLGDISAKIPLETRRDMVNYNLRLFNIHDPRVERVFDDSRFQTRKALHLLKNIWDLKPNLSDIEGVAYPFMKSFDSVSSSEKRTGLVLGMFRYLFQGGVKGVDKALVEEFQKRGIIKGVIPEGGFMGAIEILKEEGRQEGLQEGRQEGLQEGRQEGLQEGLQKGQQEEQERLALKMFQEGLDISIISRVTGFPEKEVRKLKDKK